MNVAALLDRAGRVAGNVTAVALGQRAVHTYTQLCLRVAQLAAALGLRFAAGERVALVMKNCPEYVLALFACWRAGIIAVPVNAKLHPSELSYILENSGSRLVLATPDVATGAAQAADMASEHPAVVEIGSAEWHRLTAGDETGPMYSAEPEHPAWLFYTSGTTGRPKGAVLTHRNLLAMTLSFLADVQCVRPTQGLLHAAPMSHGSGLYILPFVAGLGTQIVPESGRFDPPEIFELVLAHRDVSFFAAPTMVHRLVNATKPAAWDPAALGTIVYGGGPMYVGDCRAALETFGPRLAQIYGQGESPMTITVLPRRVLAERAHPRFEQRTATVGYAQAAVEVITADQNDSALPIGEPGEILVRGDTVMAGYWRQPDASADTLRGGWLHTGDIGAFDEEGFLTLKDRAKDVIISGGSNIYPREVEEVLLRHPDVIEVSVLGRRSAEWGEEVVAFIVAAPGSAPAPASLDALCAAHIARFKRPREYRFVTALPKNEYGKVLKTELRKRVDEPLAVPHGPAT